MPTLLAESVVDVLDEMVLQFHQMLSGHDSAARARLTEKLAERARAGENRPTLLDEILAITLSLDIPDDEVARPAHHRRRVTSAPWPLRQNTLDQFLPPTWVGDRGIGRPKFSVGCR